MATDSQIVLFTYNVSPHGRRIAQYLSLRRLPFRECNVPWIMPRPELARLNINYRRIPVVVIGREAYCDTRIILRKLEELYPDSILASNDAFGRGLERVFDEFSMDAGIFTNAIALFPRDFPIFKDPLWLADRTEMLGGSRDPNDFRYSRPDALAAVRATFEMYENGFLADGRMWILGSEGPKMADLYAVWPLEWLTHPQMSKSLLPGVVDRQCFPRVYAWIDRFHEAVDQGFKQLPLSVSIEGPELLRQVIEAKLRDDIYLHVDESDPLQLKAGQEIELWPTDNASSHHQCGKLVSLTIDEVVLATKTRDDQVDIRIHFPRKNYRIGLPIRT